MKYHIDFGIEFKRNPHEGLYIALEGIDGSGKTTQVNELKRFFEEKGRVVVTTREPRKEGLIGDIVEKVLTGEIKIPDIANQYLFSTDRAIKHEELIVPALKAGKVVITDRAFWSAIVYGILDRMNGEYDYSLAYQFLIGHALPFTIPDQTFYLQLPLETALERLSEKGGEKEIYEEKNKIEKVCHGYEWLLKEFSEEFKIIDAGKSVEEVAGEIVKAINQAAS